MPPTAYVLKGSPIIPHINNQQKNSPLIHILNNEKKKMEYK